MEMKEEARKRSEGSIERQIPKRRQKRKTETYTTGAVYVGSREERAGSRSPNRVGHSKARKGNVTQNSKVCMTGRHRA